MAINSAIYPENIYSHLRFQFHMYNCVRLYKIGNRVTDRCKDRYLNHI